MAEILMSIHGKFADMIFSGEKTIELRKSANLAKKRQNSSAQYFPPK